MPSEGRALIDQPADLLKRAVGILLGAGQMLDGEGPFHVFDRPAVALVQVGGLMEKPGGEAPMAPIVADRGHAIGVRRASLDDCVEVDLMPAMGLNRHHNGAKVLEGQAGVGQARRPARLASAMMLRQSWQIRALR
ncbi:hypothetical protein [Brevundimonas balnearis]|uniref:Uncharacterized protein n=1 Tax=Brevundimonas balnearis TaxID=1572858 RepID=A0ABV6R5Q9_9CAUL